MKNKLLLLILILISFNIYSQNKADLNKHYKTARELIKNENYVGAINELDYCYKNAKIPIVELWLAACWCKLADCERSKNYYLLAKEDMSSFNEGYQLLMKDIHDWLLKCESERMVYFKFSGNVSGSINIGDSIIYYRNDTINK